jgi:hypothetical protein
LIQRLEQDFSNPETRSHMHFFGRRGGRLYELRDGRHLAWDVDPEIAQPMIRLSGDCHAYLREATDLGVHGWVYPQLWYKQQARIHDGGDRLIRHADHFELVDEKVTFTTDHVVQGSICEQTHLVPICELERHYQIAFHPLIHFQITTACL